MGWGAQKEWEKGKILEMQFLKVQQEKYQTINNENFAEKNLQHSATLRNFVCENFNLKISRGACGDFSISHHNKFLTEKCTTEKCLKRSRI